MNRSPLNRPEVTAKIICLCARKQENRKCFAAKSNVPVKLTLQHPPRATPRAFELLKIGLFKFPPLGAKSRSNAPPISTEIPLLKGKFPLQSNTVHAFQREICRDDTFNFVCSL